MRLLFVHLTVAFFVLAASAAVAQEARFALNSGDVLEISVWGDENLTRQVLIRPDGRISFPLVGDIQAAGLSVDELRNVLEEKMDEYIHGAPVAVMLVEPRGFRVSVLGKVQKSGVFPMDGPMYVLQALSMAGGLTPFASSGSIRIVRVDGEGKQRFLPFDYDRVASGKSLEQNILLEPGDVVLVP
ncbi:MAG: polysaccharide biosynthesis/export family protein [Pseudomonadota bacterium]|nr:polysaccharide biosynthesis/export family protein [Pseudomonadota bacterium]